MARARDGAKRDDVMLLSMVFDNAVMQITAFMISFDSGQEVLLTKVIAPRDERVKYEE